MPKVLLLSGRAPVTLDHARRFANQGWTVFVADSIPCKLTTASRAVTASVRLASPRHRPDEFIQGLCEATVRWGIDLIVPTCEEVFFLSRYRNKLPASVRVLVDDFELLRTLHSKWEFLGLAQGCGAGVPGAAKIHTLAQAREWAARRPVVLKPEFSRFGVHVRLYPQGIPADAPELAKLGAWVVQDYLPGQEFSSYSVADQGRLLAHSLYQPAYRLQASASFYFVPAQDAITREFVHALVRKTNFTGQISFDWIRDAAGQMNVLECNPRATSGCHLFGLTQALPQALAGASASLLGPGATQPKMLGLIMLSAGLKAALQRGTLKQWARDFRAAEDVLVSADDWRPLAGVASDLLNYAGLMLRQRCSLREATSHDIEWDGEVLGEMST